MKVSASINDLVPITVYSRIDAIQTNNNSNDHLRFLFYQLFIQQYCISSPSSLNKNDFTNIAQDYYVSNRKEMKTIQTFDDQYSPNKDIFTWLLHDCFLRRILTQSLLKLDVEILFSLRFFIKDVFQLMTEKSFMSSQKQNFHSSTSGRFINGRTSNEQTFYRGQALSKTTFSKIKANIGNIYLYEKFFLFLFFFFNYR